MTPSFPPKSSGTSPLKYFFAPSAAGSMQTQKNGIQGKRFLYIGVLFPLLILALNGCGKHKTKVKMPIPPPAASAKSQGSSKKQIPNPPSPAPSPDASAKTVIEEDKIPAIAAVTPAEGILPSPQIRIGLTTSAKEIRISSVGDYYLLEKVPEASRHALRGEVQVRVEREAAETSTVYSVQIASFTSVEAAEELRSKLSQTFSLPVSVRENPSAGRNQVRVGEFKTREDAQACLKTLVKAGYRDAFVIREALLSAGGKTTLALRGSKDVFRVSRAGFLFLPSSDTSYLSVDGKPYRGLLDISLNPDDRITVVNQLGTEEYLLGVVPAEINPSSYPEFAALAALSIAARTYALHNLGKYRSDGFDLTDDTRSQVYSGAAAEKDATNEAVRQTAGLAVYYQNKLIDAMYMSTCGGRTEDFSEVFEAAPVPYLKSVFCTIEGGPANGETILEGSHSLAEVVLADDGSIANRNLELVHVLGVINSDSAASPEFLAGAADKDEAVRWINNARKIAQKSQSVELPGRAALDTRAGFLRYAAEAFFGADEIKRKISPRDTTYYMGNLSDGNAIPEAARSTMAYLMQNSLWRPYPDNTARPETPMRRGEALALLMRWIEFTRPEILRKGTFAGSSSAPTERDPDPAIKIRGGNKTQEFQLSQRLPLFRLDAGRTIPVRTLKIIGNEKLYFHVSPNGRIDFLEVELNPTGASSDRYSPAASWDITITRSDMAEKLRPLAGNIGDLRDIKPARTGNSGRAVQILVVGSRASVTLNGYRVRNALGLRDTLFTLTREHNPDGSVSSFTFHGRGYGHGVGLCQVGAFGMARAGRGYEEILKTYYQGVEIRKAY
jgi:stage II sporulation protein D